MSVAKLPVWKRRFCELIALEVSRMTRYYDRVLHWVPAEREPFLLERIDAPGKSVVASEDAMPALEHAIGFVRGEHVRRQAALDARQLDLGGGIVEDVILAREPAEEELHQ